MLKNNTENGVVGSPHKGGSTGRKTRMLGRNCSHTVVGRAESMSLGAGGKTSSLRTRHKMGACGVQLASGREVRTQR